MDMQRGSKAQSRWGLQPRGPGNNQLVSWGHSAARMGDRRAFAGHIPPGEGTLRPPQYEGIMIS